MVIAGPGDLYTTLLPLLLVKDIQRALQKTKAKKLYVVNIANKPFETPSYKASEYVEAIIKHLGTFPFTHVLVNTNQQPVIPPKLKYSYVPIDRSDLNQYNIRIHEANLVDEDFPLYHEPDKVAASIQALL